MNLILQIETATTSCSVALSLDGVVVAFKEINERNVHAEVLTLFIEEILGIAGKTYADIDGIAVSCGPGSYTGLRIGISTAKGLCFALDKPLIAVETLAAMTDGMLSRFTPKNDSTLFCPMIDARRMEVFTAVFDAQGNRIQATSAEIIDADSFADLLQEHQIVFFGDGAGKCREVLGTHPNTHIIDDFVNSARDLTKRAAGKFKANDFEDVAYFEPYYLKDFIAGKKSV